jgi:addiction module HigA family antidote
LSSITETDYEVEEMTEYAARRNVDRCPTHPGALLRDEILPATGKTKSDIAEALDISRQHLYDILNEKKPVSPEVAARLGKAFGDGAGIWLRMQAAYDAWHAEREVDTSEVQELSAAIDRAASHAGGRFGR